MNELHPLFSDQHAGGGITAGTSDRHGEKCGLLGRSEFCFACAPGNFRVRVECIHWRRGETGEAPLEREPVRTESSCPAPETALFVQPAALSGRLPASSGVVEAQDFLGAALEFRRVTAKP